MPQTLFENILNRHAVKTLRDLPASRQSDPDQTRQAGGTTVLYIDRHLVHEVTSPQAFEGLRLAGRRVRRPELTVATMDHNVPTDETLVIRDPISKAQIEALERNCREFGITLYDMQSDRRGIVHMIGPE